MSRFPMPCPNGWFCVAASEEVRRGGVAKATALGKELVVWRSRDGIARVADAYCPHLGAHLGVGGVVQGDALVCPFHGWRFGPDGVCLEAPYARKTPRCSLGMWNTVERNGGIFVWYHQLGHAPDCDLPVIPEHGSPQWTKPVKRSWSVRSHPQEMAENAVDSAHFLFVHRTLDVPSLELDRSDERVFHIVNRARNRRFGRVVETSVDIKIYGPGFSAVRFDEHAKVLLLAFTTPIDEERVLQRFVFSAHRSGNPVMRALVSKLFMREVAHQFEQDKPIWEHKQHLPKPILCDGDGPIWAFRHWYQRFYSPRGVERALRTTG